MDDMYARYVAFDDVVKVDNQSIRMDERFFALEKKPKCKTLDPCLF